MDVTLLAKRRLSVVFGRDAAMLADEQKLSDLATSTGEDGWVLGDQDLIVDDLTEALGAVERWGDRVVTVGDYCRALTEYAARDALGFDRLSSTWNDTASPKFRLKQRRTVMWCTVLFTVFFIALFIASKLVGR